MKLSLVKLSNKYRHQLEDMLEEWLEKEQDFSPSVIRWNDYHDFDKYLKNLERSEEKNGLVPNSVYFLYDPARDIFIGAIDIRHYLNDGLLYTGGHIGDGIRPSERGKGYATKMIALGLEECKKLGIKKVLMTCDKNNIASARTIIKNGGILENEVIENGVVEQRYWIELK